MGDLKGPCQEMPGGGDGHEKLFPPPPTAAAQGAALRSAPSPSPVHPPPPLPPLTAPSSSSTSHPPAAITSGEIKAQIKAMKKRVNKLLSKIATRFNVMIVRVEAMVEAIEADASIKPNLDELDAIIADMSLLKLDLHSIISELEFIDDELNNCVILCDAVT